MIVCPWTGFGYSYVGIPEALVFSISKINMSEFLVSIIIPTYNRCDLLPQAVESCFSQVCDSCEIIIVDDGSTDGTVSVVEELLAGDWKNRAVRYVCQANAGAAVARNHGLSLARGEYVQFLDSDDELLPGKLQKQVAELEGPSNAERQMCYCYGRMGESVDGDCERIGVEATTIEELLTHLVSRTTHVMQTSAPLWRKSFLDRDSGWDERIGLGDDLEYYLRLVCQMNSFAFVPQEFFLVREHGDSRLSADTMSLSSLRSGLLTQKCMQELVYRAGYWTPEIKRSFSGALRGVYANCLTYGDRGDIIKLESWMHMIGHGEATFRELKVLILLRKVIGTKGLLALQRTYLKLRRMN